MSFAHIRPMWMTIALLISIAGIGFGQKPAASGDLTKPSWMSIDTEARTVTLRVVAGLNETNNYWNFNGLAHGAATIVVPVGFRVTMEFVNEDPNMAHSVGIDARQETYPAVFENPDPALEGAISANPTDLMKATQSGESETMTFSATTPGEFAMLCYIPGHVVTGMWVYFDVSEDGSWGVRAT